MNTYGGFLTADPPSQAGAAGHYHDGRRLATGRACLRRVVDATRPSRVHLPFYVCDALLQPLRSAGVPYTFYALDRRLRPAWWAGTAALPPNDLVVFINYFGLLGPEATSCAVALRHQLVVDNVQAFFHRCQPPSWAFTSARKFFAVSDGAYLTGPRVAGGIAPALHSDTHLRLAARGETAAAFAAYQQREAALDDTVRAMSRPSARRLRGIDYAAVADRRRANYRLLHARLGACNGLALPLRNGDVPHSYPFLPPKDVREALIRRGVFVPAFWTDVVTRAAVGFAWERHLGAMLCPLPVDQRYDADDMLDMASRVVSALQT